MNESHVAIHHSDLKEPLLIPVRGFTSTSRDSRILPEPRPAGTRSRSGIVSILLGHGCSGCFFQSGEKREGEAIEETAGDWRKRSVLKPWHDGCLSRIVRLTLPARAIRGFWTGF